MPAKNKGFLSIPKKQIPQAVLLVFVVISIIVATILVMSQGSFDNRQRAYGPSFSCSSMKDVDSCHALNCFWNYSLPPEKLVHCFDCATLDPNKCEADSKNPDGTVQCIYSQPTSSCTYLPDCNVCTNIRDINNQPLTLQLGQYARDQNGTCSLCQKSDQQCTAVPNQDYESHCTALPNCTAVSPGSVFQNYATGSKACSYLAHPFLYCASGQALSLANNTRACVTKSDLPVCNGSQFDPDKISYTDGFTMSNVLNCTLNGGVKYYCAAGTKTLLNGLYTCR